MGSVFLFIPGTQLSAVFFSPIDIGPQVHHMEFSVHQPMTAVGTDNRHLSSPLLPH